MNIASVIAVFGALPPSSMWAFVIGTIIMALIIILRQYELAATIVIAISLYLDWYLGTAFVASIVALGLLLVFFLARSPLHPWAEPRALWLLALLFVLALFQTTRAPNFLYGAQYYVTIIFNPLIILWLGIVVARDAANVRRFFQIISVFGALVAIHTIIQTTTGTFLFETSHRDADALIISYFDPSATGVHRAESFFLNADSAGIFFAVMLFIPLGLFIESSSFLPKVLYLGEAFLLSFALLFTYSAGALAAACIGAIVLIALAGRMRYRIQIFLFPLIVGMVMIVWLPSQVDILLQHATNPQELMLRNGAWQTGLRIIQAFPLTGLGIGRDVYLLRAESYRVLAQYKSLAHPHNSYIELAALGGIPILIVFIALLSIPIWQASRNWLRADARNRSLLAGGIAAIMTLSFNSAFNAGWTLGPLAAIGWLILGIVSSPLLVKNRHREVKTVEKV